MKLFTNLNRLKYPLIATIILIVIWLFILINRNSSIIDSNNELSIGSNKSVIGILEISGILLNVDEYIEVITNQYDDNKLKALIVKVNSPGGAMTPSYKLYLTLKRLNSKIPVYVLMEDTAASGGYLISLAARKIYAYPSTITGSIGVIMESVGIQKLLEQIGIEARIIKSGKNKDIGSPFRPINSDEKIFLEELLNDLHQVFINVVLENRDLNSEDASIILDGRVLTGTQALSFGLIDSLGDLYDVIDQIKLDLNIEKGDEVIIEINPEKSRIERFLEISIPRFLLNIINKLGVSNYYNPMMIATQ